MAQSYLNKENFQAKWNDSKTYMGPLHDPLAEYERIARNRPHPGINKAYPKNTDGTLAAIIQEFPKRIIQQVPSGKVTTTKSDVQSIVANFILTDQIIPHANSQADVLQKSWGAVGKSLTFGSVYSMTFFGQNNDYFGGDFRLIYIKDIFLEKGKLTFYDCAYTFVRAWYQESDIDAIIKKETKLKASAKENGEKYDGEWDLAELKRLKDWVSEKEDSAKSAGEKERNTRAEGIEIIHGFQNGVGAAFISFAPGPEAFVRTMKNKDPRGVMPIQVLYANIDFENPLGRGVVELSGGTQNVIDSMLQSYQYSRALNLAPPLIKRGDFNKSQLKLQPNAIWDLGNNPANQIETANLDTTALNNFTNDYGLFKSQIIAMNNNGDTSVSAEVGNPGFSKTSAGVQAQQLKLGISDNYMRKQYERWISDVFESALNLTFANKHGMEEIQLNKDTARKVRELDPTAVDENDVYVINWDDFTESLKFEVDASTSDKASTQAQLEALDQFFQRIEGSPLLQGILQQYPEKAIELWNQYTSLTGVEDQEKLSIDAEQFAIDQEESKQAQALQAQQLAVQPPTNPEMIPEGEVLPPMEQLPPEMMQEPQMALEQPIEAMIPQEEMVQEVPLEEPLADGVIDEQDFVGLDEEEIQLIEGLQERGFDNEIIAQAIVMLREDVPIEEVVEIIGQADRTEEEIA